MLFVWVWFALFQAARTQLAPEVIVLSRIRSHMQDNLRQLPNCICAQTLIRYGGDAKARRLPLIDQMKSEIAYIGGRELMSGPNGFEEKDLAALAGKAAIGQGGFALYINELFGTKAPAFHYAGETRLHGRRMVRFTFQVPQLTSRFVIESGPRKAVVGYHGAFTADPRTLDVLRLELTADDIPPSLQVWNVTHHLEYARIPIGQSTFLVLRSAEMTTETIPIGDASAHYRTVTHIGGCRQYATDSKITF